MYNRINNPNFLVDKRKTTIYRALGIVSSPPLHVNLDYRYYTSPVLHDVSLNDPPFISMQNTLGMYGIPSKLSYIPWCNSCLGNNVSNPNHMNTNLKTNRLRYCPSQTFQTCWLSYKFRDGINLSFIRNY